MSAMHDDPRIWPPIPPRRDVDRSLLAQVTGDGDDPFRLAWEFLLTHEMTDAEAAAFWNGANLVHRAMNGAGA